MKWILLLSLNLFISCKNETCDNGTINSPKCDQCPPGKIFIDNQCAIQVTPEDPIQEKGSK